MNVVIPPAGIVGGLALSLSAIRLCGPGVILVVDGEGRHAGACPGNDGDLPRLCRLDVSGYKFPLACLEPRMTRGVARRIPGLVP
jgi:hypothetical protein